MLRALYTFAVRDGKHLDNSIRECMSDSLNRHNISLVRSLRFDPAAIDLFNRPFCLIPFSD